MTVDIRPVAGQVYTEERGWHDVTDTDVIDLVPVAEHTRFVPDVPVLRHDCPDGICADLAAERAAIHKAADWASYAAWARDWKAEIRRAKAVRTKWVKMRRRQFAVQT